MSKALKDIRRLLPALDAAFQAEQLKMARIVARIRDLQKQANDLERPDRFDPLTMSTRGGADLLWERWVKDRKALISRELAFAARDREAAKGDMIAALSKLEAARQMERRATKEADQITSRRADW